MTGSIVAASNTADGPASRNGEETQPAIKADTRADGLADGLIVAGEKTRVLLSNARATLFANLLNGLILTAALTTSSLPLAVVAVWMMMLLFCLMLRISVMRAWNGKTTDPIVWLKWFTVSSAVMGMAWGAVGVFLFFYLEQVYAALIIFILAGMTAGAAATNGVHARAAMVFAVPVLVPLLIYFAALGTIVGVAMAMLVGVFFAMMVKVARTAETSLSEMVALKEAKATLAKDLQLTVGELTESQLQLQESTEELHRLATTDPLTGAMNRRHFFDQIKREVYRAERYDRAVALAAFDIDHFKQINDTYGHLAGDKCLKEFVDLIHRNIRGSDLFARFGGEEFVLVLPETQISDALQLCERLRVSVGEMVIPYDEAEITFTVSVGVTAIEPGERDFDLPLSRADAALYAAKRDGRNAVQFNPAINNNIGAH